MPPGPRAAARPKVLKRIAGRFYPPPPPIYRNIAGWLRRRSGESHRQPLHAWYEALWRCRESRSAGVLRGIVLCCLVLVVPACGETDPRIPVVQEIAAVNLDSLRNLADDTTLVFEGCASSPRLEPVTAFAARRLRALGFDCAVRTVDRSVQRPTGFHTGEAQDLVAWRLPAEQHDTLPDLHLGVFYEASASEPTGLSPLASALAALELGDSLSGTPGHAAIKERGIVVTVADVRKWQMLNRQPTVSSRSHHTGQVRHSADAGPAPPVLFSITPGWLAGLVPRDHDMPLSAAFGSEAALGYENWVLPRSIRKVPHGSHVVLSTVPDPPAGTTTAELLSDMAVASFGVLQSVGGATNSPILPSGLSLDNRNDFLWFLGILLPMLFAFGLAFLLVGSETVRIHACRLWRWLLSCGLWINKLLTRMRVVGKGAAADFSRSIDSRRAKCARSIAALKEKRHRRLKGIVTTIPMGEFLAPAATWIGSVSFVGGIAAVMGGTALLVCIEANTGGNTGAGTTGCLLGVFFLALLLIHGPALLSQHGARGWALGTLATTTVGLKTMELTSIGSADFDFGNAFDAQRTTQMFTMALAIVVALGLLSDGESGDAGHSERTFWSRVKRRLADFLEWLTRSLSKLVLGAVYAGAVVHYFWLLPEDIYRGHMIGQLPHGVTSVAVMSAAVLLLPFVLLFAWRSPREDSERRNKSEPTGKREGDPSSTHRDVTEDGKSARPDPASPTVMICALMLGGVGCEPPETAGRDAKDAVDRTARAVVALPRAGDSLAVVEVIDGGVTRADTVRLDPGDQAWPSTRYSDSTVGEAPPSRARRNVAVTISSSMGADRLALVPLNDSLRVLRVGGIEVMNPDSLTRAEQWGGAAIGRSLHLSVELPRCDSVGIAVSETWLSGKENWSRVLGSLAEVVADTSRLAELTIRSYPTQSHPLPDCCERTLRRRAAMTPTMDQSASCAEDR